MPGLQQRGMKKSLGKDAQKAVRTLSESAKAKERKAARWAVKMRQKDKMKQVKSMSRQLRDELKHEQDTARAARKANRERKAENERRTMVTQEIKNIRAVKKLSPRERRRARIYLKHELNKL